MFIEHSAHAHPRNLLIKQLYSKLFLKKWIY